LLLPSAHQKGAHQLSPLRRPCRASQLGQLPWALEPLVDELQGFGGVKGFGVDRGLSRVLDIAGDADQALGQQPGIAAGRRPMAPWINLRLPG